MSPVIRRIVYVSFYEGIAILCTTLGLALVGKAVGTAGIVAIMSSAIALAWNFVFTTMFEWWESRQVKKGRSLARRIAHAIGFEGGLVVFLVPLFAWIFNIGLLEALVLDVGLLIFFLVYTFVFNFAFDKVFGLPASARPAEG
ncbi:PACE efflux transporter [Limoniibacter endophyticus]|uniref:Chlorhexidine efflux transporter domain-containing protein n=1 Tax=Limoniibacter endophyticus TaxID=1565040 RepID=A0A8J3DRU3_9HYPH|nr:PACE efflux transporter [Limoniibacter endophyticus]GHC77964.1 hypothetical protein GCM10010136_29540 [Limoniibacter endophyticus]